jgi:tetrahydromethanopterin S-methyltransferase subunit G
MIFKSYLFGNSEEVKETTNTIGEPIIVEYKEQKEVDVNKRLDDMDKKLDMLMDFLKSQIAKN